MAWLQIIIPLFTALGGYFLSHYLYLKKEVEERKLKDKREHYLNLILCLKSLSEGKTDKVELLRFEYSFVWLCAPDTVIKLFNKLRSHIKLGSNLSGDISLLIGDLVLSMRRDMGYPKTLLKPEDFKEK